MSEWKNTGAESGQKQRNARDGFRSESRRKLVCNERPGATAFLVAAILHLVVGQVPTLRGATVPFTEDFAGDSANWFDAAGAAPVGWSASDGPDDSSFAFTTFSFVSNEEADSVVLFRAQDEFGSSSGAFEGNWIAEGVTEFSVFVRHDAGEPLTFFTRFSSPFNFPGAIAVSFFPVVSDTWTPLSFAIDPANPQFVSFEGTDFETVFANIGHVQVGVSVPGSLAGLEETFTFGIDKPTIVPEPATLILLGAGALVPRLARRGAQRAHARGSDAGRRTWRRLIASRKETEAGT